MTEKALSGHCRLCWVDGEWNLYPGTCFQGVAHLEAELVRLQAENERLNERNKALRQASRQECVWEYSEYDDKWDTGCDNAFCFITGAPADNDMKFCPYCGGALIVYGYESPAPEGPCAK